MQKSAVKKPPEVNVGEIEKQDYQTPEVCEVNSLRVDLRLPHLKLKTEKDTIFSGSLTTEVAIELPEKIFHAGISDNKFKFFYRLGNRRSLPENLAVIKQSNG